ncbi:MAG: SOS response-associated peptidase [Oscillospiraceae bacterium]|nr:SOS response-associated peptidase [Oscillospiraceae bacterium]
MCGRYSVLTEDEIIEIRSIIHDISLRLVRDDLGNYNARSGEVYATGKAPVITQANDGVAFEDVKFGFKKWDGKGVIINARSETIKTTRMFSGLLNAGRCAVPAKEYYEWRERDTEAGAKPKKPEKAKYYIKDTQGNLLFFAGLYRDGEDGREFVIITKDAFGDVADVHDRMPVILRTDQLEAWLSGKLSPDEIVRLEFNAAVRLCDELKGVKCENEEQLNLF